MSINLPYFLLAAVLLLFPRAWLGLGRAFFRRRKRTWQAKPWLAREPGDPRLNFRREFTRLRNYIDLLRAGAGSVLLFGGMGIEPCLSAAAGSPPAVARQVLVLRCVIVLAGLLAQTVRFDRGRLTFYPPVFYIAGFTVGLCHLTGAIFAFVMIWAINPAIGSAHGFLTLYALLIIVFGQLFAGRRDLMAIYAGALCIVPVLLSLLSRRPLVVLSRKTNRAGAG